MKIAFHGINASVFEPGFVAALPFAVEAQVLTDAVGEVERSWLETADVIVGAALGERHPRPGAARLYQVVGAGYDAIDRSRLPEGCALCNVYGHEAPIAEYVTAALINRNVPFADADARLRRGDWTWLAGRPDNLREEWSGSRLGIVGYGRIGKEIARKAKAFDVVVHAANRSPIAGDRQVDRSWPLRELPAMCAEVDALVVTLPDSPETRGLVDAACFAALPRHAMVLNVGRGTVIDEQALYTALHEQRIAAAVIDTWYVYPNAAAPNPKPGNLPFHALSNLVMTPHMSAWTKGLIRRRQAVMIENVRRLRVGEDLLNLVP
jgi:phosphoglycerate dehydrogenase-like enzyme